MPTAGESVLFPAVGFEIASQVCPKLIPAQNTSFPKTTEQQAIHIQDSFLLECFINQVVTTAK